MKGEKAGRIDYVLLSPGLINMMTECFHFHQPRTLTDHSSVTCRLKIERASQGPGIFRATPGIQGIESYDMEIRHIIHNTLVENSGLPEDERSSELRRGASILELERKRISRTITEWETEALAIQLSLQKTPEDILTNGGECTAPNLMEFTIHKLGTHTKIFQRNMKQSQDNSLRTLKNTLNEKRDNPETSEEELQEIEQEVDEVLTTICDHEAQKMETFKLLNDEKASRAMISLEKKITGYSNMTRIGQFWVELAK